MGFGGLRFKVSGQALEIAIFPSSSPGESSVLMAPSLSVDELLRGYSSCTSNPKGSLCICGSCCLWTHPAVGGNSQGEKVTSVLDI